MYNTITDPNTGLTHLTNSPEAKQLIQNYISVLQTGGAGLITAAITPAVTAITTPAVIAIATSITLLSAGAWVYNVYTCKGGDKDDKVIIAKLIPEGLEPHEKELLPKTIADWLKTIKGCDNTWVPGSESDRAEAAEEFGLPLGDFSDEQVGGAVLATVATVTLVTTAAGLYAYIRGRSTTENLPTYDISNPTLLPTLRNEIAQLEAKRDAIPPGTVGRPRQVAGYNKSIRNYQKTIRIVNLARNRLAINAALAAGGAD